MQKPSEWPRGQKPKLHHLRHPKRPTLVDRDTYKQKVTVESTCCPAVAQLRARPPQHTTSQAIGGPILAKERPRLRHTVSKKLRRFAGDAAPDDTRLGCTGNLVKRRKLPSITAGLTIRPGTANGSDANDGRFLAYLAEKSRKLGFEGKFGQVRAHKAQREKTTQSAWTGLPS